MDGRKASKAGALPLDPTRTRGALDPLSKQDSGLRQRKAEVMLQHPSQPPFAAGHCLPFEMGSRALRVLAGPGQSPGLTWLPSDHPAGRQVALPMFQKLVIWQGKVPVTLRRQAEGCQ